VNDQYETRTDSPEHEFVGQAPTRVRPSVREMLHAAIPPRDMERIEREAREEAQRVHEDHVADNDRQVHRDAFLAISLAIARRGENPAKDCTTDDIADMHEIIAILKRVGARHAEAAPGAGEEDQPSGSDGR